MECVPSVCLPPSNVSSCLSRQWCGTDCLNGSHSCCSLPTSLCHWAHLIQQSWILFFSLASVSVNLICVETKRNFICTWKERNTFYYIYAQIKLFSFQEFHWLLVYRLHVCVFVRCFACKDAAFAAGKIVKLLLTFDFTAVARGHAVCNN